MKTRPSARLILLASSFLLLLACSPATARALEIGKPKLQKTGWKVVRALPRHDGGITYYVLMPVSKQRDNPYYRRVAEQVCGSADKSSVFFWTDRAHVPESEWMPVRDIRVMTATYERHPNYKAPHLHLAAWLYPTEEAARQAKAFTPP